MMIRSIMLDVQIPHGEQVRPVNMVEDRRVVVLLEPFLHTPKITRLRNVARSVSVMEREKIGATAREYNGGERICNEISENPVRTMHCKRWSPPQPNPNCQSVAKISKKSYGSSARCS